MSIQKGFVSQFLSEIKTPHDIVPPRPPLPPLKSTDICVKEKLNHPLENSIFHNGNFICLNSYEFSFQSSMICILIYRKHKNKQTNARM